MEALVIVEVRHPFSGVRLVEIARDDHGIAGGLRRFRSRRRRNERDLFAVRRPSHPLAGAGERAVCAAGRSEESDLRTVRACDEESTLAALTDSKCQPLAVWRP